MISIGDFIDQNSTYKTTIHDLHVKLIWCSSLYESTLTTGPIVDSSTWATLTPSSALEGSILESFSSAIVLYFQNTFKCSWMWGWSSKRLMYHTRLLWRGDIANNNPWVELCELSHNCKVSDGKAQTCNSAYLYVAPGKRS